MNLKGKMQKSTNLKRNKSTIKEVKRQVKGITLIALVVTIIVLLILAGVALNLTIGQNGIFKRAQHAVNTWRNAETKETVEMEIAGSFDDTGRYSADLAKENLENNLGATVIKNQDGTLEVSYEGYDFKIDLGGKVSEAKYFKLSMISEAGKQGEHTLGIDEEGNLWSWGRNLNGELGNGTTTNSSTPAKILEGTKFKKVDSGDWYSLAIDAEGNLWSWGRNYVGQLGNGTTTDSSTPAKILEGTKFKEISAGSYHSLAIDEEGNLWSWGSNSSGQLGNGTTTNSSTPAKILEGTKFKKISAGQGYSLAIDEEGNLWSCGQNNYGQLGNGTTSGYGANSIPAKIFEGTKFKEISAGIAHSLAIDEEGNLWSWGRNKYGQLGNGTTTDSSTPVKILEETKFQKIVAGYSYSLAIDEEENLWGWGLNDSGQLGTGTTSGYEANSIPAKILEGTKFKSVAIGSAGGGRPYSVAIDIEGNVWTAGNNEFGQLGRITDNKYKNPTFKRIEIDE